MKILIDTNVVLDHLSVRKPFFETSRKVVLIPPMLCKKFVTVKQMADISYLVKKTGKTRNEVLADLIKLSQIIELISVTREDFLNAVNSKMLDFEDALLAYSAERYGLDFIVTRNVNDFADSPVTALSPVEFLKNFASESAKNALSNNN